jgi:7,8-dihydropterin-6-yl-methyl-4-(beta-D-ribofuranosyl)aminobenzene 5'-phosphate synthase
MNRLSVLILLIFTMFFILPMIELPFSLVNINHQSFAKEKEYPISSQNINITVVFDNYPFGLGLQTSWGFSCVIRGGEKTILFDTGGNGKILLSNMKKLGIDPREIEIVVLSHIHGDHVGGLDDFLEQNAEVDVYLPQAFPHNFKENARNYGAKIFEVQESTKICENTYSTGVLGMGIKEQALIVRTEQGVIVITGCAHPGIVNIVKKAKDLLREDLLLVMGGFHLMGQSQGSIEKIISQFRDLGVRLVGPCHCSGDTTRELFQKEYAENYINIGVGKTINLHELIK